MESNWKYRRYLQQNGSQIMLQNQMTACNMVGVNLYNTSNSSSNTPYVYKSCIDDVKPMGYKDSDLKQSYLLKYENQCRTSVPDLFSNYR